MITKYLSSHIDFINKNINNGLIVYKGFPLSFLVELSKSFPFLNDQEFYEGNQVLIDKIIDNKKDILKNALNLSGIKIVTYEEFTILARNINQEMLDFKITLINNNIFYDWYPNSSNFNFPDQLEEIEKSDKFQPDDLFKSFYSSSKNIDKDQFVTYFDLLSDDFDSIDKIDFYDNIVKDENLTTVKFENQKNCIELPSPEKKLLTIIRCFYDQNYLNTYNFLIPAIDYGKSLDEIKKQLLILIDIGNKLGIEINILKKSEEIKTNIRSDFSEILSNYWNSNKFRKLVFYSKPDLNNEKQHIYQDQIIEDMVSQTEKADREEQYRDIFVTAPTGSGKSLLFQIPAIYLTKNYDFVTIVVSPLKALMYDQVMALINKGVSSACFINSDISFTDRQDTIEAIKNGEKSILYLSPELLLSYSVTEFIGDRKLGLLVIDEAHLVSTWGRDFRVDYWYLGKHIRNIRKYSKQEFPVMALTATAVYDGPNDIVFQTIESLNMRIPKLYIGNVRRDEIKFEINKFSYSGNHEEAKIKHTKNKLEENISNNIKTISYFPWTRQIETVESIISSDNKDFVGKYYSGVDKHIRQDVINKFKDGSIRCVIATKAFGMGVDISDILEVYHHAPSGNISDYLQEIGRVARKKTLIGKAVIDFCDKDLKFTKILYGLSSVKLYQIKLILEKIYNVYSAKKKQNLLFSVEDFEYIFPNARDIDSKVKSTMLLIENDLLDKYGYYVVLVRPKSLYSTVFAEIPSEIEKDFLIKYKSFCKKISKPRLNKALSIKTFDGLTITQKESKNNFYIIELDKLWEKHFFKDSFPKTKKKFFDKELFSVFEDHHPIPLSKLSVSLNKSIEESYQLLELYWKMLCQVFQTLSNKFFTADEFEKTLKIYNLDNIIIKRISDLVLNTYSSRIRHDNDLKSDSFLQMRTENNIPKYRVMNNRYFTVSKKIKREFSQMFSMNEPNFEKYVNSDSKQAKSYIKLLHQIESFRIGSYEFTGGMQPRIFVRINDPFKLRLITTDFSYKNNILDDINNRYESSIKIMDYFFTENLSDDERWDFIENYFLGKNVEEEIN